MTPFPDNVRAGEPPADILTVHNPGKPVTLHPDDAETALVIRRVGSEGDQWDTAVVFGNMQWEVARFIEAASLACKDIPTEELAGGVVLRATFTPVGDDLEAIMDDVEDRVGYARGGWEFVDPARLVSEILNAALARYGKDGA